MTVRSEHSEAILIKELNTFQIEDTVTEAIVYCDVPSEDVIAVMAMIERQYAH